MDDTRSILLLCWLAIMLEISLPVFIHENVVDFDLSILQDTRV